MTKNWPDRIRLAVFAIILIPFITLILFLIQAFTGVFTIISMNKGIVISVVIVIIFDICFVATKCNRLRQNELADTLPDMNNQNNINLPRTIIAIVVTILAIAAYVNYKLYSVAIAKILLLICILISAIEIIYLKAKRKN
ncbi:hypothetical protein [Geobacter grbiciae]|uniref:hypothetical protein n=1 Tax=Geobacter grbiciae TaxID=155042 RepID=UPI001C02C92F|nr:hypothetical protein [Geobacter grbiciae]MBT1075746.1 hypothetical protein [Geobacter grbiciae]